MESVLEVFCEGRGLQSLVLEHFRAADSAPASADAQLKAHTGRCVLSVPIPALTALGCLTMWRCRACCHAVQFDEEMAARAQEAEAAGQKLVYVGFVEVASERCTVGLKVCR